MERTFLADSMLGRLAKWLRIMGFDTHYQSSYKKKPLSLSMEDGRTLLTRNARIVDTHSDVFFISSNLVKDQISELHSAKLIISQRSKWFTRCIRCNVPLLQIKTEHALDHVPEYIYFENVNNIKTCPRCGRFFWPGTHRHRMIRQLEEWGL